MNTDKARRLLKKIQALLDNLSDQGTVSALERDLLLSYLRELYEEVGSPITPTSISHEVVKEPMRVKIEKPAQEEYTGVKPPSSYTTGWNEPPKPVTPEPAHTRVEQINVPIQQPVAAFTPVNVPVSPLQSSVQAPVSSPSTMHDKEDTALTALFEFKEVGELAEKLKLQPLDRIEHGMGINERILTVNELFGGDNELFKKTLDYLNDLQSFRDAQSFLTQGVGSRFNWADERKKTKAVYFIQLVRRRFVSGR